MYPNYVVPSLNCNQLVTCKLLPVVFLDQTPWLLFLLTACSFDAAAIWMGLHVLFKGSFLFFGKLTCAGDAARPRGTEPLMLLGRHSTSLSLTAMQQPIDAGSSTHSLPHPPHLPHLPSSPHKPHILPVHMYTTLACNYCLELVLILLRTFSCAAIVPRSTCGQRNTALRQVTLAL